MKLTAIIEREGDGLVMLCPELDIAKPRREHRAGTGKSDGGIGTVFRDGLA